MTINPKINQYPHPGGNVKRISDGDVLSTAEYAGEICFVDGAGVTLIIDTGSM